MDILEATQTILQYEKITELPVKTGDIYGVVGSSNSGKSNLLQAISKLEEYRGLQITSLQEISNLKKNHVVGYKSTALVTKTPALLFNKNVWYNVALPLSLDNVSKGVIQERIQQILYLTGLQEYVSTCVRDLTLVQQQKVSLARALSTYPNILLCDEIHHGLGQRDVNAIVQLLQEINRTFNTTIILASKEIYIIKNLCKRFLIMHDLNVVAEHDMYEFFVNNNNNPLSRQVLREYFYSELPSVYKLKIDMQKTDDKHPVVSIMFSDLLVPEFTISNLLEQYDLHIVIIQGYQEVINKKKISVVLAEISGGKANLEAGLVFLRQNNCNVEILGYVDSFI